jgi:hypothetical protein
LAEVGRRRTVAALAVGVAICCLSGCTPAPPQPRELICSWVDSDDDMSFELQIYGGLRYEGILASVAAPATDAGSGERLTGEGTWSYGSGLTFDDGGGFPAVTLNLASGDRIIVSIRDVLGGKELVIPGRDPEGIESYHFDPDC